MFDNIPDALADLKQGKVVIVVDDEDRENEGDFVAVGSHATPDVVNFMITHGRGLLCVPITEERAQAAGLAGRWYGRNTDNYGTAFTVSVDHATTHTGISAFERAQTIAAIVADDSGAEDFRRPGHIFPLIAKPGGVLRRAGHTEAARRSRPPVRRTCRSASSARSSMRTAPWHGCRSSRRWRRRTGLKLISIADLIACRKQTEQLVERIEARYRGGPEAQAMLPTVYGLCEVVFDNKLDDKEHVALVKGDRTRSRHWCGCTPSA